LSLNAMAAALRRDVDRAQELAAQAELFTTGRRVNYLLAGVQLARGAAQMSTGRYAQAYTTLRRLFDPADPCHHVREKFRGVMYLAEAAVHAHQVPDARALVGELEDLAAAATSPTLRRQLAYARAVLADDDHAEELFRTALDDDLVRWPLVRARLELAYGSWLRRRRRPTEAREPLRSAWAAFTAIGATTWAESARGELRAAGENTRGDTRPAVAELLSAQELQVARLVAEGLSNKQIGERLYLSPRTIGSHLYRIFPKLDVTSRGQLAARLAADDEH
jgi:DNA-binding CsgD family transcriptional regulator